MDCSALVAVLALGRLLVVLAERAQKGSDRAMHGSERGKHSMTYSHPHPDPGHVMRAYRRFILGTKRVKGTARHQHHYRAYVTEYLAAKRAFLERRNADV